MANNYVTIPSLDQEGVDVDKQLLKQNVEASIERGLNLLPNGAAGEMTGKAGRPLAVNVGETGPAIDVPVDLGQQTIRGYLSTIHADITAASTTLDAADAAGTCGQVLVFNSGSAQTLTVNSGVGNGWNCSIYVKGAGQLTVAAGTGLTLRASVTGHSKSANQYARLALEVIGSDLSLMGNTAA